MPQSDLQKLPTTDPLFFAPRAYFARLGDCFEWQRGGGGGGIKTITDTVITGEQGAV